MKKKKKIGLSLSLCIADICRREVQLSDVKKIISRTCCPDEAAWERVISWYQRNSWRDFPDRAEQILWQLLADGKIEQPKLININHYPLVYPHDSRWVDSEEQIKWTDVNC